MLPRHVPATVLRSTDVLLLTEPKYSLKLLQFWIQTQSRLKTAILVTTTFSLALTSNYYNIIITLIVFTYFSTFMHF